MCVTAENYAPFGQCCPQMASIQACGVAPLDPEQGTVPRQQCGGAGDLG